jgi:hypothetical protein
MYSIEFISCETSLAAFTKICVTNLPIPSPARLRCTCGVFLGNFGGLPFGATTAVVLQQFLSYTVGSPFKAPANFNSSLKFSECRRRAVKKNTSQSSWTVAVRRLNWHRSAIFQRQYDFSSTMWDRLLVCACKAPGGEQECSPRATGRWPAGLKGIGCSRTGARGASYSPPTARKGCPVDN